MRSIPQLSSVVAYLVGFLPSIAFIDVMRYVMFELLRAQEARLCQEFGSANDIRPCIQPHSTSSFPNTAYFSIHPLVTKLHHTALQDLWGWLAWWKMHGRCCTGLTSGYPGSTIYAKCVLTLLPGYESPALGPVFLYFPTGSTFHPVRMHMRLVPTSGDHQRKRLHLFHASGHMHYSKLVHLYHLKMCTLQDGHGQGRIPFSHRGKLLYDLMHRQVLGCCLVWHLTRPQNRYWHAQKCFWLAHMRVQTYKEHSG